MINVEIKPEDVDRFVKESFMQSAIGSKIAEAINKAASEALLGYNSPVQKLVFELVKDQIKSLLNSEEYQLKIKQKIAEHFTNDLLDKILNASVQNAIRNLKDD